MQRSGSIYTHQSSYLLKRCWAANMCGPYEDLLYVQTILVLVAVFIWGGLSRHHQLNWLRFEHDNPVRARSNFLPGLSSIMRSRRLDLQREAPGISWVLLPTSSTGLYLPCALENGNITSTILKLHNFRLFSNGLINWKRIPAYFSRLQSFKLSLSKVSFLNNISAK